jgi:hypothetical protein
MLRLYDATGGDLVEVGVRRLATVRQSSYRFAALFAKASIPKQLIGGRNRHGPHEPAIEDRGIGLCQ